ncbi:spoU rRNA Methylase family protein [Mycobacterium xenopi 4042]|uniref:SpoU rRNA Methylase family protein n=1 Tax=Mycobacterium xenopi 4042 TaxID=1299334 RepID=X7YIE0_MYCXE|nr:spoU rRNA Methylase family protein [Mycobacterium xenopi 4042]
MFRVVFYSPRIAPNTGNAIRMVAATGAELHLVEPLGSTYPSPSCAAPAWTITTWRR